MEFKEIEKKIKKVNESYGKVFSIKIDENYAHYKLHEEVGEFTKSWMIYKGRVRPDKKLAKSKAKEFLAEELADIIGITMMNADQLGIDLEEAINKKWFKYLKR